MKRTVQYSTVRMDSSFHHNNYYSEDAYNIVAKLRNSETRILVSIARMSMIVHWPPTEWNPTGTNLLTVDENWIFTGLWHFLYKICLLMRW